MKFMAIPNEDERIASNTVTRRFDHSKRNCCSQSSIYSISSFKQHPQTSLSG